MMMRIIVFVVTVALSTGCYAASAVFSFYDDGGEHGYADACDSGTESLKYYHRYRKKIKGPNPAEHLLGHYSDNGDNEAIVMSSWYFYSSQESCDKALKKARAWYDKEFGEETQ